MVQIVEILGRSEQGMTRPFICRGEDGNTWFVKGIDAGRRSQVCEWIAGKLALALELPVAPFELVDVPNELVEMTPEYQALGPGPAFGSLKQTIMELNYAKVSDVPMELQRSVLGFDWWIRNNDRMLSEAGGNPNLFWEPEDERLVVIDHNQAFDPEFSADDFLKYHVFCGAWHTLFDDAFNRQQFQESYCSAFKQWETIREGIPEAWYYLDPDQIDEADIDLDAIFRILNRCTEKTFWNHT